MKTDWKIDAAAPGTGPAAPCVQGPEAAPFDGALHRVRDWDAAYDNQAACPGFEGVIAGWERDAPAFRAALCAVGRARLDLPYGDGARERWDLFLPELPPLGLALFIHGGWWMRFDRTDFSHLAAGPVARGWAVAMPSYPLAPGARISGIVQSAARALNAAAAAVPDGPVVISGWSAGGHLAARLLCADQRHPDRVARRIARGLVVSGLADLRPLLNIARNADLKLSAAEAAAESPALLAPAPGAKLIAWVGAGELPEFRRQSALLANMWRGLGAATALAEAPGRDHFDVMAGLADPRAALTEAMLGGL